MQRCLRPAQASAVDAVAPAMRSTRSESFSEVIRCIEQRYLSLLQAPPIAETRHSSVYRTYSYHYGRFVAIKIINKRAIPGALVDKFLPRELEVTQKVRHPHLCRSFDVYEPNPTKVIIVSEYCEGGTLLHLVLRKKRIEEPNAARMYRQLCEAVHYLHARGVAHRDIKLENILLDDKCDIKLADFGFSRYVKPRERSASFCGTKPYSAPDLVDNKPYDPYTADWYAMGVVLYTILLGRWPYEPTDKSKPLVLQFPANSPSASARVLIEKLLEEDDHKRASYKDCVDSEWMKVYASAKWILADDSFVYEILS
ncbi:CAMK protein kinase [Aphelenchoides avenae]|nr:CAMK protein kinase [Aphelenchus avenae]